MARYICLVINRISNAFGMIGALLIGLIALLLGYDVFMRYALNNPTSWVLDIVQLLQAALALLTGSYVLKIGGHVNMNLLLEYASNKWRKKLAIISSIAAALGCAWMSYLSWNLFTKSLLIKEATYSLEIPLYPWKFLVPFCFALISLQAIAMTIEQWGSPAEKFAGYQEEL